MLEDLDSRGERIGCSHGGASLLCLYDLAD